MLLPPTSSPPWHPGGLNLIELCPLGPAGNGGGEAGRRGRGRMEPAGNEKREIRRRCATPLSTTTAPEPDGEPISRGGDGFAFALSMIPVLGSFMQKVGSRLLVTIRGSIGKYLWIAIRLTGTQNAQWADWPAEQTGQAEWAG